MSSTQHRIRQYIIEFAGAGKEIPEDGDLSLLQSGIIDSFRFMELLSAIEREFEVRVDFGGHDPEWLTSLNGLTRIVAESLGIQPEDEGGEAPGAGGPESMEADHANWAELAGLFEAMHAEFDGKGLLLPLVTNGAATWLAAQAASPGSVIGAVRDGRLAGFVSTAIKLLPPYLGGAPVGEIVFLYVVPEHRRSGLGRELAEAAIGAMKTRGVHSVELKVLAGNEEGRRFWEALGFLPELYQMRRAD